MIFAIAFVSSLAEPVPPMPKKTPKIIQSQALKLSTCDREMQFKDLEGLIQSAEKAQGLEVFRGWNLEIQINDTKRISVRLEENMPVVEIYDGDRGLGFIGDKAQDLLQKFIDLSKTFKVGDQKIFSLEPAEFGDRATKNEEGRLVTYFWKRTEGETPGLKIKLTAPSGKIIQVDLAQSSIARLKDLKDKKIDEVSVLTCKSEGDKTCEVSGKLEPATFDPKLLASLDAFSKAITEISATKSEDQNLHMNAK